MLGYLDFYSTVLYTKVPAQTWVKPERKYGLVCQMASYLQLLGVFVHVESIRREEQAVQGMIWFDD